MLIFNRDEDLLVLAPGETIFKEGEIGESMYFVVDGQIDIVVRGQTVETLGQGGMFGEMALIDDKVRSATAVAAKESRLAALNKKRFMHLVKNSPDFALEVMQVMADRLREKHG